MTGARHRDATNQIVHDARRLDCTDDPASTDGPRAVVVATDADAVRADVHDALATATDHSPATRVAAVDALASLPTAAVTPHGE